MRFVCFTWVLLFSSSLLSGQTATRTPAKVLDFGQLYSTYNWDAALTSELKKALGETLAAKVIAASVESAWPAGISTLEGRTDNRPLMASYKLYFLTTVDGKAVLVAPAGENRQMPANLRPANDMYFIVNQSAVEVNGTATPVAPPSTATNFQAQMNLIVDHYADGFMRLIGAQIAEDEDGLAIQYASTVEIENAAANYFIEDLLSSSTSFHAEFGGSPEPKGALKTYLQLISKVEALQLNACKLSKNKEEVAGNVRSQVFQAYDPAGNLALAYQNMNIELRIVQGETMDKSGQAVSDWYVSISVYER